VKGALGAVTAIFTLLIAFSFLPYWAGVYNLTYLVVVVVGVDLFLIAIMMYMWKRPQPETFRRISAFLKVDMLVGLLAVILGSQ
jgi:4-hydroxybenzoate polyprenyltransferase